MGWGIVGTLFYPCSNFYKSKTSRIKLLFLEKWEKESGSVLYIFNKWENLWCQS